MSVIVKRLIAAVAVAAALALGSCGIARADIDNRDGHPDATPAALKADGWKCANAGVDALECTKSGDAGHYDCSISENRCGYVAGVVTRPKRTWAQMNEAPLNGTWHLPTEAPRN